MSPARTPGDGRRRVAITGVGIVCCVGLSYLDVVRRIRRGASGLQAVPQWADLGISSQVAGLLPPLDQKVATAKIPKGLRAGMSEAALYCSLAAIDAVHDAGLDGADLHSDRAGCFVGTSIPSVLSVYAAAKLAYSGRINKVDPFNALRCMSSSASAAVGNLLGILGPSYSIDAACATSTHNIGHAYSLIAGGSIDIAVAGGGEAVNELAAGSFHAMRYALSSAFNDTPTRASRPFDSRRDGFVLSEGSGIVVLEELGRARERGQRVRAEVIGYGATSDGYDMVAPDPEGRQAAACMQRALQDASVHPQGIDYVNVHATSTPSGDRAEVRAMHLVFGDHLPKFSSTKSMTGHSIGASGGHETIFCVGMLENGFLAPSINIESLEPTFEGLPIVKEALACTPEMVMTNSFGFGGTNASLVLRRDGIDVGL